MVDVARVLDGCSVAVLGPEEYDTAEATRVLPGPRSSNVALVTVEALTLSLKVAVTDVVVAIALEPAGGVTLETWGGVVSGPVEVTKTTSTQ